MNTLRGGWARAKVGACEVHGKDGPLASPKTGGGLAGRTWAAASEPTSGGRAFAGGPGGSVTSVQSEPCCLSDGGNGVGNLNDNTDDNDTKKAK